MNLFELSLKLSGFPIVEAKSELKKIQAISPENFESYVVEKRNAILDYHLQHNSFYKSLIGARTITNWSDVPVMQKRDLQRPLKERLSDAFSESTVYVNKTSGSSGHPFIFAKDKFCHALTWAEILDRFGWYGLNFHNTLQARFYGIPLDIIGYQKERLKDRLSCRYRFPIFDLSEQKLGRYLTIFRKKKFHYINGYTSSIVLFAKYVKSRGIVLKSICPSLKYCVVTSEMLYDTDKELMENAFGVPVVNEYGASELDLLAFTDREGDFILNSETLYIEIVDAHDRVVPKGVSGRIVITSLYNKAHPMIRYDIGDSGMMAPESTFKKPILKQLTGRTNDVAKLPGGKTVPGLTFYYVTKSVIEDDGNVKEFVIEQTSLDTFLISYVSERTLTEKEEARIMTALYKYLENDLHLVFDRKELLDRSHRGKLKQFNSSV